MPDETVFLGQEDEPIEDLRKTQADMPSHLPTLPTPHTVMLVFADNPKALQFELLDTAIIGRRTEHGDQPDIDLAPYGGFPGGVSRHHLRISRSARGIWVEDLNSTNGTFLNEIRLIPNKQFAIRNGQALRLGHLYTWVYFNPHA
jgi:hypothetical protein